MACGDDEMDDQRVRETLESVKHDLAELDRLENELRDWELRMAVLLGEMRALKRQLNYLLEDSECQKK